MLLFFCFILLPLLIYLFHCFSVSAWVGYIDEFVCFDYCLVSNHSEFLAVYSVFVFFLCFLCLYFLGGLCCFCLFFILISLYFWTFYHCFVFVWEKTSFLTLETWNPKAKPSLELESESAKSKKFRNETAELQGKPWPRLTVNSFTELRLKRSKISILYTLEYMIQHFAAVSWPCIRFWKFSW